MLQLLSFDEAIARYWQDQSKAVRRPDCHPTNTYPLGRDQQQTLRDHSLESHYRELALKTCDIIDLINLPEDDRHLASHSHELKLRRLYVALRMRLEAQSGDESDDKPPAALEQNRAKVWGSSGRIKDSEKSLVSLGERLQTARRLVVLGDPGAGKSTLLRWLATAYLLRLHNDTEWRELPDIASLPENSWLPILVRCRDLPSHADTLDDMLHHSLRKAELADSECKQLRELLRSKLTDGTALLLVDGFNEITEPSARERFSRQLEQIHRVMPKAPIVVTSHCRLSGHGLSNRCRF